MKRLGWGLVMLLLPLALFGWATVQHWRAETAQEQARITRQWLAAPSDTLLQALPWAARKQFAGRVDTGEVLQRQLDELDNDRHWLSMRKWMASFSGWLALGALVAGIGAWLRLRVDAWRALRSAHYLHQRMTASWRVLGRWLSAYMGLLAGSLCLVLLYETSAGLSHAAQGGLTVLVVVLPLASVLAVCLRTLWRMRQQWPRMGLSSASFLGRELGRQGLRRCGSGSKAWLRSCTRQCRTISWSASTRAFRHQRADCAAARPGDAQRANLVPVIAVSQRPEPARGCRDHRS